MSDIKIIIKIVIYGSENPHVVILRQIGIIEIWAKMGGITEKTQKICTRRRDLCIYQKW